MVTRNDESKPWSFRRRVVVTQLAFCVFCIFWVMVIGAADAETGKTIVASAFALMTAVTGSYIFGAVWDDKGRQYDKNNAA